MGEIVTRTLQYLAERLSGGLSQPGDERYDPATRIWAKPTGPLPRAIAHCRTTEDVRSAILGARDCDLSLSVRGGGHDWAGRALRGELVIDLQGMNSVEAYLANCTARIGGGARAADVIARTGPHGLAAVTGSVRAVGLAGLTLGGGYGPLIGRCGLALDNLLAAEVVLWDGRIVLAHPDNEPELQWRARSLRIAPSSAMNSKAPLHEYLWRQRPSVCVATTCSSRYSQHAPTDRIHPRQRCITIGLLPHARHSMRLRCLADMRTFSPAMLHNAPRRPMAQTPRG